MSSSEILVAVADLETALRDVRKRLDDGAWELAETELVELTRRHHVALAHGDGDGLEVPDDIADESFAPRFGLGLVDPEPGRYRVLVIGFDTAGPTATYDLTTWTLTDPTPDRLDDAGPSLRVTGEPDRVRRGDTVNLRMRYRGLTTPGIHLAIVSLHDGARPDRGQPVRRPCRAPAPPPRSSWPSPDCWPSRPGCASVGVIRQVDGRTVGATI